MMDRFEDELRRSLARVEPPEGFADRVLARVDRPPAAKRRSFLEILGWHPFPRFAYAGAALAAVMTLGVVRYEHQQREKALAARDQLKLALRIAGGKLEYAKERVAASAEDRE